MDPTDKENVIRIGVIGLTTKSIQYNTGTDISSLTITNYVEETKKWEAKLRNENKVHAVIVVAHFGPYCPNDGKDKYIFFKLINCYNQLLIFIFPAL